WAGPGARRPTRSRPRGRSPRSWALASRGPSSEQAAAGALGNPGGIGLHRRRMTPRRWLTGASLVAASLAIVSCSDKDAKKPVDPGALDAGKEPVVGGKLGAAIASAEAAGSAAPGAKGKAQGADEPPANGIFGPGEADKRQPPNAPPK